MDVLLLVGRAQPAGQRPVPAAPARRRPGGSLATDFGPGDKGYVGGRWWVDANGNGEMDSDDAYFSCPLLGKGTATAP